MAKLRLYNQLEKSLLSKLQILINTDDGEEDYDLNWYPNGYAANQISIGNDGTGSNDGAFRFLRSVIPNNAKIVKAVIRVKSAVNSTKRPVFVIKGLKETDPKTFASNYTTGTVAVTNLSPTVNGTGTNWDSSMVGKKFKVNADGGRYIIQAVVSATQLTLSGNYTGTTASGQAYTISDGGSIRPKTTASVAWTPGADWAINTWYESPDISSIINELITQPEYTGKALGLVIEDNASPVSNYENIWDFNSGAANAVRLILTIVPNIN